MNGTTIASPSRATLCMYAGWMWIPSMIIATRSESARASTASTATPTCSDWVRKPSIIRSSPPVVAR